VITSCEVGRAKPDPGIFLEAARRLDVAPSEVLHVGDRWELDVEGARRAGLGAALYRGLWPYYPSGMYPETDPALLEDPDVGTIDRLDGVLSADLRSDRE
jgi:putative hydrolase of the HAD superfamily